MDGKGNRISLDQNKWFMEAQVLRPGHKKIGKLHRKEIESNQEIE